MKILIGHANMDLDCFGSMVLARYLYPEHRPVVSSRLHPSAKNLYNLYRDHLGMLAIADLRHEEIDSLVMVDTSSRTRVAEFLGAIKNEPGEIIIYDHHRDAGDVTDFPGAELHLGRTGSNTTLLALACMEQGIGIDERSATIALAGIYADTGDFRYGGTVRDDFDAAGYCLDNGASLGLVNRFVKPLREQHQLDYFHLLLSNLSYGSINGHFVITTYLELDRQTGGLAAVVEKVFEIESPDIMLSLFYFREENQVLIVARSLPDTVAVDDLLVDFGGGGHRSAASALIKNSGGEEVRAAFFLHIENRLKPAVLARDIMTSEVLSIDSGASMMEASIFFEKTNHTGCPVLDAQGKVAGFLTLRDIMKARKGNRMASPVSAYMTRKVITCKPASTLREIENLMFTHNIGHVPVVETEKLAGIITRSDYLKWYR